MTSFNLLLYEFHFSKTHKSNPINLSIENNTFQSISDFILWIQQVTEQIGNLIQTKESTSTIITKVIQYVQNNIANDLNRDELTKLVHLHPDYLSSIFRQKTGYSLTEFITRERVNSAKKMLLTTDLPIHEVAISTGFQSISYFSKQFKRLEGITPFRYRKSVGHDQT